MTVLLVEQNTRAALSVASYGYVMDQGKVVLDGTADALRNNEDVKEFYLGGAGDQRKSFKNLEELPAPQALAVSGAPARVWPSFITRFLARNARRPSRD